MQAASPKVGATRDADMRSNRRNGVAARGEGYRARVVDQHAMPPNAPRARDAPRWNAIAHASCTAREQPPRLPLPRNAVEVPVSFERFAVVRSPRYWRHRART